MNISEKVIDIVKGMEGIGGMPTDEEFLNEFEFRLQSLKQGQTLPLDNVIVPFVCRDCDKTTKEYRDQLCEPCHKWHTDS